jgi:hypothetical protein
VLEAAVKSSNEPTAIRLSDFSTSKVNIIITKRLAIKVMNEQTVAVAFKMSSKLFTLASSGKVQNQHPGHYLMGCRFVGSTAHQLTFFFSLFSCFST